MAESEQPKKEKFIFNCKKCGNCCENRGPIPITFWDLELWAKANAVSNFLPYLKIYKNSKGFLDLILAPTKFNSEQKKVENENPNSLDIETTKCPLFNMEKRQCLVYNFRPLSCRTYPLEFDGEKYQIVDLSCPGIGFGEMTKETRLKMRDEAERIYKELITLRTSIPLLQQIIQREIFTDMMKQQQEIMKNMDPEDLKKLDELLKKK
jgi:Fe-S-cluster containining protein